MPNIRILFPEDYDKKLDVFRKRVKSSSKNPEVFFEIPTNPDVIEEFLWVFTNIEKERQRTPAGEPISYPVPETPFLASGVPSTEQENTILENLRQSGIIEFVTTNHGRAVNIIDAKQFQHVHNFLTEKVKPQVKSEMEETELLKTHAGGESYKVEFKSTLRWNIHTKSIDDEMQLEVAVAISAFLNTNGGTVLIGVKDDGVILGLEDDYKTFPSNPQDRVLRKLLEIITKYLGGDNYADIGYHLNKLNDKDILVVRVRPSNKPVYLYEESHEDFYTRSGTASIKLSNSESTTYITNHWKK